MKKNIEIDTDIVDVFSEIDICKKEEWISMLSAEIESYYLTGNNYSCKINKKPLKIDGINVYIYISIIIHDGYTYSFETSNIILVKPNRKYHQVIVFESENYFDNVRELFDEMIRVRDTYVFLNSKFIPPAEKEQKYNIVSLMPHLDICSVCFENTFYYTLCNHLVCFKCREKCIEYKKVDCPICRQQNVKYYKEKEISIDRLYYEYDDMDIVDLVLD